MTPGARAITEYLAEILAADVLAREAAIDQPAPASQNAPGEEEAATT